MRSTYRIGIFLLAWLAGLAALAASAFILRFGALGDDLLSLALPWAVPAALSAIAAWAVAKAAYKPLSAALRAAERLAGGDAEARLPEPRSGELAALARAFNALADAQADRLAEAGNAAADRAESLSGAMEELRSHDEARARDARMAARMQRRIVPRLEDLPSRPEIAFGAVYLPAENTGGDLYDAVRAGKNGLVLLAADVSGRGVTAALIAAIVKNAFRGRTGWDADPAAVMSDVNEELLPIIGDTDHFVTAFLALLDLETGLLRFANAGHPPAFLLRRRKGGVEELDAAGSALGVQADVRFVAEERKLEEGDRILLFTDGLTGSRDYRGEAFGRERLSEAFLQGAALPATETANAVAAALESFRIGAPRSDDVVALACEFRSFAKPEDSAKRRPSEREDWRIMARRGTELAAKGRIEEAVGVYERLLELEPSDATSLNNLGTLYWRLGRREDAAERFKIAASIDPSDPRIQRNLALAARVTGLSPSPERVTGLSPSPPSPEAKAPVDVEAVEEAELVGENLVTGGKGKTPDIQPEEGNDSGEEIEEAEAVEDLEELEALED